MNGMREGASLLAAIGHLSLAGTAWFTGRRSVLAKPLSALCFCLFGWNFATFAYRVIGGSAFSVLDSFFTALSPAFLLEVVLTFVGRTRIHRIPRTIAWTFFGALAVASLGGFVSADVLRWLDEPSWAAIFVIGWGPSLAFEAVVLSRHLAGHSDPSEKARTRTVVAALAIGAAFSSSDLARALGFPLPYLGALGSIVSAALLASLVTRHELFERNLPLRTAAYVGAMVVTFVTLYLVTFRVLAPHFAFQAFAIAIVTMIFGAVVRELVAARAELQGRARYLTALGRFSAQMAHDIRGPLTALLGATQMLEAIGDDPGEGDAAQRKEFIDLASDQARRIAAIVERYDRMARIEPRRTTVDVNDVVTSVARSQGLPPSATNLDPRAPWCDADRDLLESSIENVVRNAVEANGGTCNGVSVESHFMEDDGCVAIRVRDTGEGMDARTLTRIFDDFFTTKTSGSGLGLPFVRRVMTAHGGEVHVSSERGKGTSVELRLPVRSSSAP